MESVNIDGDISGQVGYSNLWYEADFFSSFTSTCTFIISWQWGLKAGSGLFLLVPEHEVYAPMVSVHICQLTVNYLCAHVFWRCQGKSTGVQMHSSYFLFTYLVFCKCWCLFLKFTFKSYLHILKNIVDQIRVFQRLSPFLWLLSSFF